MQSHTAEGPLSPSLFDLPWLMTIDNIFFDVARKFPDNKFLEERSIQPGTQNTAFSDKDKSVALEIITMKDGLYGSKKISATVGGCALNTSRAANFYLQAVNGKHFKKVYTLGVVGQDDAGKLILEQLERENLMNDIV